ncbi:hypothetical protein BC936DRAFT_144694 [Jimgerdemannia flammicorona]|uniref:Uncharacterized protein n=1 Tax=Jimgerdemannia flammicorona TaxID=994334 RepID=A0A433DBW5_9FUNG|nr:hypothetical protein BC936DRAFT_144694 [Jimgerdemannia flammicorona]
MYLQLGQVSVDWIGVAYIRHDQTPPQGFKPQKSFTKGMEQLLRTRESVLTEPLKNVSPRVGKPMFMVVEEDAEFLPDDAARVLRRLTVGEQQELAKMAEQKHQFVLEGHAESDEKPRVVSPVKREGNRRFKFLITDKGRKEEGEEGGKRFLIRDQDGTLRVATKMEIGKRLLKHH